MVTSLVPTLTGSWSSSFGLESLEAALSVGTASMTGGYFGSQSVPVEALLQRTICFRPLTLAASSPSGGLPVARVTVAKPVPLAVRHAGHTGYWSWARFRFVPLTENLIAGAVAINVAFVTV